MRDDSDAVDRRPEEYLLFAAVCLGCAIGGGGVILSSPGIAFTGAVLTLVFLWCYSALTPTDG